MWAEKDFSSLGDTKIYEKIRIFVFKNFRAAWPRKGLEKMMQNTNRVKIIFCNFYPELQINLIIFPFQEIVI